MSLCGRGCTWGWRRMAGAGNRADSRRWRQRLRRPLVLTSPAKRRANRGGVDEPAKWRSRRLLRLVTVLTAIAVLVFVLWLAWVAYLFFARGGPSGLTLDPDRRCSSLSFSCGIITNILA